jgi:hypothetical protein
MTRRTKLKIERDRAKHLIDTVEAHADVLQMDKAKALLRHLTDEELVRCLRSLHAAQHVFAAELDWRDEAREQEDAA